MKKTEKILSGKPERIFLLKKETAVIKMNKRKDIKLFLFINGKY